MSLNDQSSITGNLRSPQKAVYFDPNITTNDRFDLEIRVWKGDVSTDKPSNPVFSLFNYPVADDSTPFPGKSWYWEFSEFIKGECEYPTNLSDEFNLQNNRNVWFEVKATDQNTNTNQSDVFFGTLGWESDLIRTTNLNSFTIGVNISNPPGSLANPILVPKPWMAELPSVIYYDNNAPAVIPYYLYINPTVSDYQNVEIIFKARNSSSTFTQTITQSDQSSDQIKYLTLTRAELGGFSDSEIDGGIDIVMKSRYFTEKVPQIGGGTTTEEYFYEHDPITVYPYCGKTEINNLYFVNRYGAVQNFPIRGRINMSLNRESESYMGNIANGVGQYDNNEHVTKDYNVFGNEQVEVNTGNVAPDEMDSLLDLFMSERVWIEVKNYYGFKDIQEFRIIPLKLDSTNFNYYNDRYVRQKNYNFTFNVAKQLIQNIK